MADLKEPVLSAVMAPRELGRFGAVLVGSAATTVIAFTLISWADGLPYRGSHPVVVIAGCVAMIGGSALSVRWSDRLYPRWAAYLCAMATIALALVAFAAGGGESPFVTIFYVWIGTAFLVLPFAAAVAEIALAGVLEAVILGVQKGHPVAFASWEFAFGVTVLTGVVMKRLVDTFGRLAESERHERASAESGKEEMELLTDRETAFLTRISHEVRTPLNVIIGFADMLGDGLVGQLNEQQADYVNEVRSSGHHLMSLIGDVLDVAKVEKGEEPLQLDEVAIADVVGAAANLFRAAAERGGVTLEVDDLAPIIVRADQRKVRQVVLNLLSNAVKFTPRGGHVTVTTRRRGPRVSVVVSDDGPGIARDDIDRIFEEYGQAQSAAGVGAGTGLGLPLARRFAEQHGGSLTASSEPGHGSTFVLDLPVAGPAGPEAPGVRIEGPPTGLRHARFRPLDNPDIRASTRELPPILGVGAVALGLGTVVANVVAGTKGYHLAQLLVIAAVALGVASVASWHRFRLLTTRGMTVLAVFSTIGFSLCDYYIGTAQQTYGAVLFAWIAVAAVAFVPTRLAWAHIVFLAACYGVLVAVQPGNPVPVARWLVVVVLSVVSALAVDTLLARLSGLADAEHAARVRLEAVRSALEEASRHRSRFLATMSHELRTPLNAIIGFSEVLGDELFGELTDTQREYVHDLTEAGHELLALVNDILDLAKVDAGRMELDLVDEVDVGDVLRSACADARAPVDIDVPETMPTVQADPRKLARMIANLADEEAAVPGVRSVELRAGVDGPWLTIDVRGVPARPRREEVGSPERPLRVMVASAFAQLHGGRVDIAEDGEGGWRLVLPVAVGERV